VASSDDAVNVINERTEWKSLDMNLKTRPWHISVQFGFIVVSGIPHLVLRTLNNDCLVFNTYQLEWLNHPMLLNERISAYFWHQKSN